MPRVVVTRWIPDEAVATLRDALGDVHVCEQDRPLTTEELRDVAAGAEALVTMLTDRVDGELLDAAGPQLKVVANVAVGYDNVDVAAAAERGVTITNTPGVLTDATADLALALLLSVTRRLPEAERAVRSGEPWKWSMDFLAGAGLRGKTLGVVGLGEIGRATAFRARAFGMEVVYWQRSRADEEVEQALGGARKLELAELLDVADVVTLHCPLTPQTRHLIDADALRTMGPGAYLINTARGAIVDEPALAEALRDGVIAGAGLDVFENEPLAHPGLRELDNVSLAPHIGSSTVETRDAMAQLAAENVVAVLEGREPSAPVRP